VLTGNWTTAREFSALAGTLELCLRAVGILERDTHYRNLAPKGEPQLGRRGLYGSTGGTGIAHENLALLWVPNYSDGEHSLLEIAEKADMEFAVVSRAADRLRAAGLLEDAAAISEPHHQVEAATR